MYTYVYDIFVAMCLDVANYSIILIYLTSDNFTSQGESAITWSVFTKTIEWIKL
jgi:hypothetical protein